MYVINPIFGPLSIKVPCIYVKFMTSHVILILGAQIYLLVEICTTEIELWTWKLVDSTSRSWDEASRGFSSLTLSV